MKNPHGHNIKAVAWVTAGTALFSLIFASGRFAEGGASASQIQLLRYVGGLATLLLLVAMRREGLSTYQSNRAFSHLVRAVLGALGGGAMIHASANMPIVDATAIGLLYVVFVIPLGVLVLKERLNWKHLGAIAVCCTGAAMIVVSRGAFTEFQVAYVIPACIAILSALFLAVEGLMIKILSHSDRAMTVLLYVNAFGILVMIVPAAMQWSPLSFEHASFFLMLGSVAATGQYCMIKGYRLASLSIVGPVDYSWLLFAGLIGFLFFDEIPTLGVILGSATIIAGGIALAVIKPPAHEHPST